MVEAVRHLRSTAPYWDRSVSDQCSLYRTGTGTGARARVYAVACAYCADSPGRLVQREM